MAFEPTGLFWKIASPLLTTAAKAGVSALLRTSPVEKAIAATAEVLRDVQPVRLTVQLALEEWVNHEDFVRLLQELRAGERDITNSELISRFITVTRFHAGEQTDDVVQRLLSTFAAQLVEQLYASEEGRGLVAQRQEVLFAKALEGQHALVDRVETLHQAQQGGTELLLRKLEGLEQLVQSHRLSDDPARDPQVQELIHHSTIDHARQLLKDGKTKTARALLFSLRSSLTGQVVSRQLEFRIATNLGACAVDLGDKESALAEFDRAMALHPDDPKALANAGVAALLRGAADEALRLSGEARRRDPASGPATATYLQAMHLLHRGDEIEQLIATEPLLAEDPTCLLVLADLKLQTGDYMAGEQFARAALRRNPEDPRVQLLLAQAILAPIQDELHNDPPLPWRLPAEVVGRIEEGDAALSRAIAMLANHEHRPPLHEALVNRAGTRLLLSRFSDAITDCDRVLAQDAAHSRALYVKGLCLLQLDQAEAAVSCFERVATAEIDLSLRLPMAHAYLVIKRQERALALLEPAWVPDSLEPTQLQVAEKLLTAYRLARREEAAEDLVRSVAQRWPADPEALAVIAEHRRQQGNVPAAIEGLREALTRASSRKADWIALELGNLYYEQDRSKEAARLFGRVVDPSQNTPVTRRYLISLLNSGAYREALRVARLLRKGGPALPLVTDIETRVLEYIGDLDEARRLLAELAQVEPANVGHRVRLVLLELRRGDDQAARDALARIRLEEIAKDPQALIQVAKARARFNEGGVLPLVYAARRQAFGKPDMHLAYIGLFLSSENTDAEILKEPDQVQVDCTVQLERGGERRRFTILADPDVQLDRGELSSSDPLAAKLLGRRKGDQIVIREDPFPEAPYTIVEIQSKYVSAFQETVLSFTTWFPDNRALSRFTVIEHDITPMLVAMDRRHELVTAATQLYKAGQLTLTAVAKLTGSSVLDVWSAFAAMEDGRILASTGTAQEAEVEAAALHEPQAVVLDGSALMTIEYLGLADAMARQFSRLLVPRAVADEIGQALNEMMILPAPAMTVAKHGNEYVRQEISAEAWARRRQHLELIRDFICTRCTAVAAPTLGNAPSGQEEHLERRLGPGSLAAVLVAREQQGLLYADDLALRRRAETEWRVPGAWSQSVLLVMRDNGTITEDEYREAVKKLALANYGFIRISMEDLLWVLQKNHMTVTPEAARVFRLLHGPDCEEESAVQVLADLAKAVWLEPGASDQQRFSILDIALTTLATGRNVRSVAARFKRVLRPRLRLLPFAEQLVIKSIDLWQRHYTWRGGTFGPRSGSS